MNVNPHLQYLQQQQSQQNPGNNLSPQMTHLQMQQQQQQHQRQLQQQRQQLLSQQMLQQQQQQQGNTLLATLNGQNQSKQGQNQQNLHNLQSLQNLQNSQNSQSLNSQSLNSQSLNSQNLQNLQNNSINVGMNGGLGNGSNGSNPLALMQMQQQLSQNQRYANPQQQHMGIPRQLQESQNPAGLNQNLNQGFNQGFNQNLNQGLNQNLNQNLNQGLNQNLNQNLSQGLNQNLNQNLPQGLNLSQNLNQNLQNQLVPVIKEVWAYNVEFEFTSLRSFINDKTHDVFISIHQEIPGIVARPFGTFRLASDYHFQTLRLNLDMLNLIQVSLCALKVAKNGSGEMSNPVIWQFNFRYDVQQEMFNEEHLAMLALLQIHLASHVTHGIPHMTFAELMIESGLLLDPTVRWVSYHLGYDLGFFVSLLTNNILPAEECDFFWWCAKYFPNFYDMKHIGTQLLSGGQTAKGNPASEMGLEAPANGSMHSPKAAPANPDLSKTLLSNNKPSIEYLAEELHLLPISPVVRQYFAAQTSMGQFSGLNLNQQMTSTLHAYLLMECFKELWRQFNSDVSVFDKYKGYIWGLGDMFEGAKNSDFNKPLK